MNRTQNMSLLDLSMSKEPNATTRHWEFTKNFFRCSTNIRDIFDNLFGDYLFIICRQFVVTMGYTAASKATNVQEMVIAL